MGQGLEVWVSSQHYDQLPKARDPGCHQQKYRVKSRDVRVLLGLGLPPKWDWASWERSRGRQAGEEPVLSDSVMLQASASACQTPEDPLSSVTCILSLWSLGLSQTVPPLCKENRKIELLSYFMECKAPPVVRYTIIL